MYDLQHSTVSWKPSQCKHNPTEANCAGARGAKLQEAGVNAPLVCQDSQT